MNQDSEANLNATSSSNSFYILLIIMLLGLIISCEPTATDNGDSTVKAPDTTAIKQPVEQPKVAKKPDCKPEGTVLEGNEFWAADANLLMFIAATEEVADEQLGESHRVLFVYDGDSCKLLKKQALPINRSPDYAYYISDINYNNNSQILAIQGFDQIFCFDIAKQQLQAPVKPFFLNERYAEDAQTGLIKRLELWEDYIIGYAIGMGSFVFDLSSGKAKPVEPFAEFEILEGEDYASLFLLKSKNDAYQAILPNFDVNTNLFQINPIFPSPAKINTQMNPSFRNNRFIILKEILDENSQAPTAIDMKNRAKVTLPTDLKNKKNTDIINWLKQNS